MKKKKRELLELRDILDRGIGVRCLPIMEGKIWQDILLGTNHHVELIMKVLDPIYYDCFPWPLREPLPIGSLTWMKPIEQLGLFWKPLLSKYLAPKN